VANADLCNLRYLIGLSATGTPRCSSPPASTPSHRLMGSSFSGSKTSDGAGSPSFCSNDCDV